VVPIIKFVPAGIDTHFLVAGEKCLCAVVWEGWIAAGPHHMRLWYKWLTRVARI
jgi:hypothetical protein